MMLSYFLLALLLSRTIRLLMIMGAVLAVALIGTNVLYTPEDEKDLQVTEGRATRAKVATKKLHADFDSFRRQYIAVYLVIMLADWMQGTHMYTLYLSYGVNISALFLTGFLSGAIFAPFLGSAVDKFGRKKSCIVYCVLEIIINVLEHCTNFQLLLLGRVLGGISTNLLFSAFESWMTTEHRHRGFPDAWLARTYSAVSMVRARVLRCFIFEIIAHQSQALKHFSDNTTCRRQLATVQWRFLLVLLPKFLKISLDISDRFKERLLLPFWPLCW